MNVDDDHINIVWNEPESISIFEIKNAKVEDSGTYRIEAINEAGVKEFTVQVAICEEVADDVCEEASVDDETSQAMSVEPELVMEAEAIVVDIGELLKLSCTVKGACARSACEYCSALESCLLYILCLRAFLLYLCL